MLYQTAGTFHNHLRYPLMAFWQFIEGRIDDFYLISHNRFLNIRNLLRTFIDQQDDQMHIRMIGGNRLGYLF